MQSNKLFDFIGVDFLTLIIWDFQHCFIAHFTVAAKFCSFPLSCFLYPSLSLSFSFSHAFSLPLSLFMSVTLSFFCFFLHLVIWSHHIIFEKRENLVIFFCLIILWSSSLPSKKYVPRSSFLLDMFSTPMDLLHNMWKNSWFKSFVSTYSTPKMCIKYLNWQPKIICSITIAAYISLLTLQSLQRIMKQTHILRRTFKRRKKNGNDEMCSLHLNCQSLTGTNSQEHNLISMLWRRLDMAKGIEM